MEYHLADIIGTGETVEDALRPDGTDALIAWSRVTTRVKPEDEGRPIGEQREEALFRTPVEQPVAAARGIRVAPSEIESLRARPGFHDLREDISPEKLAEAIAERMAGRAIDLRPGRPRPRGTFTDTFQRADEDLEASPNWSRPSGTAGSAAVVSNTQQFPVASSGDTPYLCPDQGSGDNYVEIVLEGNDGGGGPPMRVATRLTDGLNYIGVYFITAKTLWKRAAGSYNSLGAVTWSVSDSVCRLEANGDQLEFFIDTVSRIGPVTESFNQAETGQGLLARGTTQTNATKSFEAGTFGPPPTFVPAAAMTSFQRYVQ